MRAIFFSAALVIAASAASAQVGALSAAKSAAQNAAAATNAHIEAEQHPDGQQSGAAKKSASSSTKDAKTAKSSAAKTLTPTKGAEKTPPPVKTDTAGPPPSIYREVFDYGAEGRRDPFNSLLSTSELRPTMSDLRLTGVLFDPADRRSGATLRDVSSNAQYKVSVGSTLGRMRVSTIRNKTVVFTIEEFGTTRQDSLVLGDSTKVRRP